MLWLIGLQAFGGKPFRKCWDRFVKRLKLAGLLKLWSFVLNKVYIYQRLFVAILIEHSIIEVSHQLLQACSPVHLLSSWPTRLTLRTRLSWRHKPSLPPVAYHMWHHLWTTRVFCIDILTRKDNKNVTEWWRLGIDNKCHHAPQGWSGWFLRPYEGRGWIINFVSL